MEQEGYENGLEVDNEEVDGSVELPPQHTSDTCSRCGWANKDLNGSIFRCGGCGLTIDRQLNAAINLYLRMEGVPTR